MAVLGESVVMSGEVPDSIGFEPLVSVVIPTYNRPQPTLQAAESALCQTYKNCETILIDDGSTNGASEVLKKFVETKAAQGENIRYIRQANQGPSAARNTGIMQARGEYVAFLDSDDTWLPEKLEFQIQALGEFRGGACFTDAAYVRTQEEDRSTLQMYGFEYKDHAGIESRATAMLAKAFCGFWTSTLIAKTEILREIGGFDSEVTFAEDRDLCFRLSLATPFVYVNRSLALCDRNSSPPGTDCRPWDKVEVRLRGHQRMYEKWLSLNALPSSERKIILDLLRSTHCSWANVYLNEGQFDEARVSMSRALGCGATPRVILKWALSWLAPGLTRKLSGKPSGYL
jgi:glycosyltransferase involved in cell wall biosynthesis